MHTITHYQNLARIVYYSHIIRVCEASVPILNTNYKLLNSNQRFNNISRYHIDIDFDIDIDIDIDIVVGCTTASSFLN